MTTRADPTLKRWSVLALLVLFAMPMNSQVSSDRPRARQAGVIVGSLPPGPLDAMLGSRNLERLASRAIIGLARTGSNMANGSGDYVIAFSTAPECRRRRNESHHQVAELSNDSMSPLFQAVAEATEEAIYNSLFRATTARGFQGTVKALPPERTLELLRQAGALSQDAAPPSKTKKAKAAGLFDKRVFFCAWIRNISCCR